jgi:type I restriction enzyme, S subunit
MRKVVLSELAESVDYGVTAPANNSSVGPKFLRITDIQNGMVDWASVPFCEANDEKLISSRLKSGDIVFARTGATTGKSFLIKECPDDAVFASYLIRVRPNARVDSSFLAHFFDSPDYWSQVALKAVGAAQPGINASKLKELKVPLPSMSDQKRIAAILDQAAFVRRKRQDTIRRLNDLNQALFYETFGDPATNPRNWPIGSIGDLTASTQYGTSSKAAEVGAFPILRMGNILPSGEWTFEELKFIDIPSSEVERYTVRDGDILFNRTNSPELVGKTGVYRGERVYAYAGYLVRLRVNSHAVPEYVGAFLNTPYGKKTLRGMCKAIIGMANINAQELRTIPIPLTPIALQKQFLDRVFAIQSLLPVYREHLEALNALFSSLQHRAFRGELTSSDAERQLALAS